MGLPRLWAVKGQGQNVLEQAQDGKRKTGKWAKLIWWNLEPVWWRLSTTLNIGILGEGSALPLPHMV